MDILRDNYRRLHANTCKDFRDSLIGVIGTPERDAYDLKLKERIHKYLSEGTHKREVKGHRLDWISSLLGFVYNSK